MRDEPPTAIAQLAAATGHHGADGATCAHAAVCAYAAGGVDDDDVQTIVFSDECMN